MTTLAGPTPCTCCGRYAGSGRDPGTGTPTGTCAAFPDGIPLAIYTGQMDHRVPIDGDHGLQWTPGIDADTEIAEYVQWRYTDQGEEPPV